MNLWMKKRLGAHIIIFVMLGMMLLHCGHKAAPLAKDRLKPSLNKISALNNRQLLFTFSEVIAVKSLTPDQIRITANTDSLPVLALYPSLSNAEIVLITGPQAPIEYMAVGSVFDTSENKGNFQLSFKGTDQPDTVAPQVIAYRKGKNSRYFVVQFTEAMDTTVLDFLILPTKIFSAAWTDLRQVLIRPVDSTQALGSDTTYCCWLRRACDLSGNEIPALTMTITLDTAYQPLVIRGQARNADTALVSGVAVLSRGRPISISLLRDGSFYFEVRDSLPYLVDVFNSGRHGQSEVRVGRVDTVMVQPDTTQLDRFIR